MAELALPHGKSGGRQLNKLPVRVDLTALVDLAFLLITFFMLTTSLAIPRSMPLAMPAPGPVGAVAASSTMTICIGKNNQAVWYIGAPDKPITTPALVACGNAMNKTIMENAKRIYASSGKNMFVVVKPSVHSIYKSLVSTLDELNITNTSSYAIASISAKDIDFLKQKNIY